MIDSDSGTLPPNHGRPHLVILGAGASLAAFPHGDKHGRQLPVMKNFIEVVGLGSVFDEHNILHERENFEALYSGLVTSGKHPECVAEIERIVFDYFSELEIPDRPTLYDHLVLSLRPKDLIATFNWDPFLWMALNRNARYARMPQSLHLHGNVAIGYCCNHDLVTFGSIGGRCRQCGVERTPSRLLYPVTEKNYNADLCIKQSWQQLQHELEEAFVFTIFGYSAPTTDVKAKELLMNAWDDPHRRVMKETEIIDIRPHDDLYETWEPFICRDHYQICDDFYQSIVGRFPRRSVECMWTELADINPQEERSIPKDVGWEELRQWYHDLVQEEDRYEAETSAGNQRVSTSASIPR